MKKKIYFIAASMIQILFSIYAIISADKIVADLLTQIEQYPVGMQERINGLFNNSGHMYIIVISLIFIVINGFIIYWAATDKLLKNKGKVVAGCIFGLFSAFLPFMELVAIISIIVILCCKREKEEDYPDKKKPLPVLEKEKITKKKVILAIILLAVYFSQFLWSNYIPDNSKMAIVISLGFYALMITLSIIFFKDLLSNNFKMFIKNFKAYFQNLIGNVGKFYLIYIVVAMVVAFLLNTDVSENQKTVEALPIWYSLPLAVIYAPIVEETLFRGCIRRFIKSDKLFIAISGLSFGLLHTAFSGIALYDILIQSIPYVTIGCFLAYLYVRANNICTNMAFHCFHNSMAMILLILMRGI